MLPFSFSILGVYLLMTLFIKRGGIRLSPLWMPHGDHTESPSLKRAVPVAWALLFFVGIVLLNQPTQRDAGEALFNLFALTLGAGLLFGLYRHAHETAHGEAPSAPLPPPQATVNLVESPHAAPNPFGSRAIAPGLHISTLPPAPEEIAQAIPQALANRIIAELDRAKNKTEETIAANTQLRADNEAMRAKITELDKTVQEQAQAAIEMNQVNQALRSKSTTVEKAFSQMTIAEIEKARDAREREIRNLDEIKRARTMNRNNSGG